MHYYDLHTHLLPPKRLGKLMKWTATFMPDHPVPKDITATGVADDLQAAGAQAWVNLLYPVWEGETRELNAWGAELARQYPQMLTMGGVHLTDADPLEEVRICIQEHGFAGIKFHPMVQKFSPGEDKLRPIYPYLAERGRVVYTHTGYDEWYGWTLPWEHIEWIAREHPQLGLVLSHCGFPRLHRTLQLARECPNVWLDLTNVGGSLRMMHAWGEGEFDGKKISAPILIELLQNEIPPLVERTIFGTDHPAGIGDVSTILNDFLAIGLDKATETAILTETPERFLEQYRQ